jgi:hypothetical protein
MMNLVGRDETIRLQTLLAKRMLRDIQLSDFTPAVAVILAMIGTIVTIILPACDSFMFRAITPFPDQGRATGISATLEGKLRHRGKLLSRQPNGIEETERLPLYTHISFMLLALFLLAFV